MHRLVINLVALGLLGPLVLTSRGAAAPTPLDDLLGVVPADVGQLSEAQTGQLIQQAQRVDDWIAGLWWQQNDPEQIIQVVSQLLESADTIDAVLNQTLSLRTKFAGLPDTELRREQIRQFLRSTACLIDLSGRGRHRLREVTETGLYFVAEHEAAFLRLTDLVQRRRSTVAATVLAGALFDPEPTAQAKPFSQEQKYRVLQAMSAARSPDLLPVLAEYVRQESNPSLVLVAAAVLTRIGLPQRPRAGHDPQVPPPPIIAEQLREIVTRIQPATLSGDLQSYRTSLLAWLDQRIRYGVLGDTYRVGDFQVQAGDWLLLRNPSPYNMFTDLSPGLFTHVGVVAVEDGNDGIRRFVIVDMPERGAQVPATTVDAYLTRTLHYVLLRHRDAAVLAGMGRAAAAMIGNDALFDLNFDTARVLEMQGKPLEDARIHTYCAGFLLLCAQAAGVPREDVFPVAEATAGGQTADNLQRLGLSFGRDFLSPTGAIFAPQLEIVGWREPMYDPGREVQQRIYDHFAQSMMDATLTPSPDAYQLLREKLAGLAKQSEWLTRAMAQANDVSEDLDLESAARAAAVIETLDGIAEENLAEFHQAWTALMAGELTAEIRGRMSAPQAAEIEARQARHTALFQQWTQRSVTARQVRTELVEFYVDRGQTQLDRRFFEAP